MSATYEKCTRCGRFQRVDLLGWVCGGCGWAIEKAAPSSIVNRTVYRSPSLRNTATEDLPQSSVANLASRGTGRHAQEHTAFSG